jgi:hexokinase
VLKITPFDESLDQISINPRKQAFEKLISGMYLGEVVRHILLHLIKEGLLFQGKSSPILDTHYGLDTALMSSIEATELTPNSTDFTAILKVLELELKLPAEFISNQDCILVYRACELAGTRALRLAAVALAAMYRQIGSPEGGFAVGVDGSLVEFYPRFEERVRAGLKEILGEEEKRIEIGLAKDGSGVGAALTALQAKKQKK